MGQAEVSVLLTDDETVHRLNRSYRGHDKPTDVLSFSLREQGAGEPQYVKLGLETEALGDIVISVDTAEQQARAVGVSLEHEVTHLALHGALHLLGYTDDTEEGLALMEHKAGAIQAASDGPA